MPRAWQHLMQRDAPVPGMHVCCLRGRPGSDWAFRARCDPALSISLLLEGRIQITIDDGVPRMLESGHTLWVAMDRGHTITHEWQGRTAFHMVHIHVGFHLLQDLAGLDPAGLPACLRPSAGMGQQTSIMISRHLQRIAAEIGQCPCRHPRARSICLHGKVLELLAAVIEHGAQVVGDVSMHGGGCTDHHSLMRARALLERHGDEAWSVPALARAVGLNEKQLQAGFRGVYGMTVHGYLTRIRLDQAIGMLLAGCSVTETAQAVGFANLSHFSKVFRLRHGMSPRSWLREFRNPRFDPSSG
ncbi:DNA-binding domain-containing protein, AraC-type [Frateuria aurantia DSM 6220]|uniref:DNA-binding domain-containing protein, AraC-type n=2 Tax=Frateuria aurantia TaxID=81475 RepID=H8L0G6_FRAAD|nr:DNA-binding domain-containing protein, AraC-type [Frateuria aurantia DSM 6220]